ncbi:ABC transporter permease [Clostridia bacterium]|nr:ABC transporter permease [Clostridia bacterium]
MTMNTARPIPARRKRKPDVSGGVIVGVLILWALIIFYPFYNALLTSIVPYGVYTRRPFLLYPPQLDFGSYRFIFSWRYLWTGFRTTLIVLFGGLAVNMFLTIATGYVMSKPDLPGRKWFNIFIVFTLFFQGGMIPGYLLIQSLGLLDSYWSMILPLGMNVFNMMLMRSYFHTIPSDLEDAARIDGAGEIRILMQVYLPLALPMLATVALYYAVDRWNEWYNGMLYIRVIGKQPLQLLIKNMLESATAVINSIPLDVRPAAFPQGIQMAGVLIAMLPIALVYPFLQRFFISGLTLGGVKG